MKRTRKAPMIAALVTLPLALTACVGGNGGASGGAATADDSDDQTLTVWHYENEDSAMGQAWAKAIEIFKEEHPDVTV